MEKLECLKKLLEYTEDIIKVQVYLKKNDLLTIKRIRLEDELESFYKYRYNETYKLCKDKIENND